MPSVFDRLLLQNPAETRFVALAGTVAGVIIPVVFILTRRALRRRYFARRDRRSQYIQHKWMKTLEGKIPVEQWFFKPLDHSIVATITQPRRISHLRLDWLRNSLLAPPISILVPARNEQMSIVESVRSLLALDYPELEVIVVNDGSTDNTLDMLRRHFHLMRTDIIHVSEIPMRPVRAVYASAADCRLLVLDKESCGRKADVLNAALNAASSPFVLAVDADAILEKDALLRIIAPALTEPQRVIASGGIVRVANGRTAERGASRQVRLPRRPVEIHQVIEYLRAFLIGRQGWAQFNLLLIISGAFGVFRRDLCRQIGGFRTSAVGEDMDLVVRLHRYAGEKKEDYEVAFVPYPVRRRPFRPDRLPLFRHSRWRSGPRRIGQRNEPGPRRGCPLFQLQYLRRPCCASAGRKIVHVSYCREAP